MYLIDTVNGGYYHSNEIIRTIGSLAINGSPHGNMPIWFLFSYFVVRVFFGCQRTFFKQISFWGILLFCVLIPYLLHFCSFRYPYYFANIFIGLLGYYIGYIYKKRAEKYANILVPISAFLYIGIFVLCDSVVDIRTNTLYSGYYLLWIIWSISGCMFFYYIFNKIRFPSQLFTVLGIARIGELSMTVLVLHWPALILADFVKYYCLDIPKNYSVIYYLTIVLVVSVVLHKYLKQTKLKFLIGL